MGASAGRIGAGLLVAWALAAPAVVAEPWYAAYERGQLELVAGRPVEAEAALRQALTARPEPGCRLRTYGLRVSDYAPWYYMGVALEEQGRLEEALAAQERSRAAEVLEGCPGLKEQRLDQRERLERLRPEAPPAALSELRDEALSAGADELAPELVATARELEAGCTGPCSAAAAAWLTALSRARVAGPLRALLLDEAEQAWQELTRAGPTGSAERPVGRLEGLRRRWEEAQVAGTTVEELLDLVRELETLRAPSRPAPSFDGAAARAPSAASLPAESCTAARRSILLAEQALSEAGEAAPPAARDTLAQARRQARSESPERCRVAVVLAERVRAAAAASGGAPALPGGAAILELRWSHEAQGLPRALVGSSR